MWCVPALLCCWKQMCQSGNPHHVTMANLCSSITALAHFLFSLYLLYFLWTVCLLCCGREKESAYVFFLLFKHPPFLCAVCAIRFMVCQKSAMHEKLPPLWSCLASPASPYSSFCFLNGLESTWASLVHQSKELCLVRTDKSRLSLGARDLLYKHTAWVNG